MADEIRTIYELADLWDSITNGKLTLADRRFSQVEKEAAGRKISNIASRQYWNDLFASAAKDDYLSKPNEYGSKINFNKFICSDKIIEITAKKFGILIQNYLNPNPSLPEFSHINRSNAGLSEDDFNQLIEIVEQAFEGAKYSKHYNPTMKSVIYKLVYKLSKAEFGAICDRLIETKRDLPLVADYMELARPYLLAADKRRMDFLKRKYEMLGLNGCELCHNSGLIAAKHKDHRSFVMAASFRCTCDFGKQFSDKHFPIWGQKFEQDGWLIMDFYKKDEPNHMDVSGIEVIDLNTGETMIEP